MLLAKLSFWKRDWGLGYVFTQIWDFRNISLFPRILSLKLFGNSWGNSCTKFAILDITFRFTFGESDLYYNIAKFQNIMTKIVAFAFHLLRDSYIVCNHILTFWFSLLQKDFDIFQGDFFETFLHFLIISGWKNALNVFIYKRKIAKRKVKQKIDVIWPSYHISTINFL